MPGDFSIYAPEWSFIANGSQTDLDLFTYEVKYLLVTVNLVANHPAISWHQRSPRTTTDGLQQVGLDAQLIPQPLVVGSEDADGR